MGIMDVAQKYIVDAHGKKVGVLISYEEYMKILSALEELESIKAYDAAKSSREEVIPFQQAVKEIEHQYSTKRKKK